MDEEERIRQLAKDLMEEEQVITQARAINDRRIVRYGRGAADFEVANLLKERFMGSSRERLCVVYLDFKLMIIDIHDVFVGSESACEAHAGVIAKEALLRNATSVILAHNHPSGCDVPSQHDIMFTKKLKTGLQFIDIALLDHLVIGTDVTSMSRLGLL
jgi:DNA repair protein RadC